MNEITDIQRATADELKMHRYKTIKTFADECNVSKTAIRTRMTDKIRTEHCRIIKGGVIVIDEIGCNQIKEQLQSDGLIELECISTSANNMKLPDFKSEIHENHRFSLASPEFQNSVLTETLKLTIETLQEQLRVKDEQIKQQSEHIKMLTNSVDSLTQSLNTSQALHAGSIQQQLIAERSEAEQESEPKKQSFFSKFRKNK